MTEDTPRWQRRLLKAAIVICFAGGLSLFGAALGVYADQKCLAVPFLNHCAEARWAMLFGGLLAIGALVVLWRRTVQRRRA
ncbi:hypothetical protein [Wenxinia saemankumensis]|uniref:Uncharacterized protein n=1 Tax=Wenxinia saemankumensis TaxID=1447782 RepID=A0A1M6EAP3_9RHOB|nr:hypothetical protein [Wenxinia saemankumensis]SHI82577.1 hypothetical protein SAMN05444417_1907 [Wenxinia saemankumensis]